MKKTRIIPLIALSISVAGCSTLEKVLINSDVGQQAISRIKSGYINGINEQFKIEDFGIAEKKDDCSDKPILFFIYGWGGNLNELGEKKGWDFSRLEIMKEVFEDRVILADYPSTVGIETAFSNLEQLFLSFEKNYSENNSGKKPKIIISGHSFGSQIARLFIRKYNNFYFESGGEIGGINEGVSLGVLTNFARERLPKHMDEVLSSQGRKIKVEDYQILTDMMAGSEFFKRINTPTPPLNIKYDFYVFSSKKDSWIIPGEDDQVTSVESAYPIQLIKENRFENVGVRSVMVFKGDVDHDSIDNPEVLRMILKSLKSENKYFSYSEVTVKK